MNFSLGFCVLHGNLNCCSGALSDLTSFAFRLDDAYNLLDEMIKNKASDVHQVIGQMIKGDYDDGSNWQIVEYIFDKINSEGCALGMKFCNTLLEALWWLGQKERAARVLNEASKRGLFPELFRISKLVWSVDVHRYGSLILVFGLFGTAVFELTAIPEIICCYWLGCGKVVPALQFQFG